MQKSSHDLDQYEYFPEAHCEPHISDPAEILVSVDEKIHKLFCKPEISIHIHNFSTKILNLDEKSERIDTT